MGYRKSYNHLGVRPTVIFSHLVVNGSTHILEYRYLEKSLKKDFDKSCYSVNEKYSRKQNVTERMAGLEHHYYDKQAERSRACIAHKLRTRACVKAEISKQNAHHNRTVNRIRFSDCIAECRGNSY